MKTRATKIWASILCIALTLSLFAGCISQQSGGPSLPSEIIDPVISEPAVQTSGGMTVTASESVNGMISTLSVFTVRTENDMTEEELLTSLTLSPRTDVSVTKSGECTFEVTPSQPLQEGTLYRFTWGDPNTPDGSFVFQTESDLIIKQVFPADKSTNVRVNTGIEITFSEPLLSGTDLSEYISCTPEVKGRFELYPNGKTVAFIPESDLDKGTVYAFTVKEGIPSQGGKSLAEGKEFKFRTSDKDTESNDTVISLAQTDYVFGKNVTEPVIKYTVYTNGGSVTEKDTEVVIYRFDSAEAAAKAIIENEKEKEKYIFSSDYKAFSTEGLTKHIQISVPADNTAQSGRYSLNRSITLPALEGGVYLVELTFSGKNGLKSYKKTLQCFLQVTDLVLHTQQSNDSMLIWLNSQGEDFDGNGSIDIEYFDRFDYWNSEASDNAQSHDKVAVSNGMAEFAVADTNAAIMVIKSGDDELLRNVSLSNASSNSQYYSFLFTDRNVYFPDDKISFSGIITPLEGDIPEKLYYTVGYNDIYYPLQIAADGTYQGHTILESMSAGSYPLRIYDGEKNLVSSAYLRVTAQEKPMYKMSIELDRPFYRNGDTVTVTLSASFYDGTPAEGLKFNLYSGRYVQENVTLVTDARGKAVYTFVTGNISTSSTYPVTISVSAELIGEETTYLYDYADAIYFHSDYWFECETVNDSAPYTEVRLNYINTSGIETKSDLSYPSFPANIIGTPSEGVISVRYIQTKYIKHTERNYDPITKTSNESYYYTVEETTLKTEKISLTDGKARIDHITLPEDFEGFYSCDITFYDAKTKNTYKLYSNITDYGNRPVRDIYSTPYYSLTLNKDSYKVGDTVTASATYGAEPLTKRPTLFVLYSNGRQITYLSRNGEFSFRYEDAYVPGARIYAFYFDGSSVLTVGNNRLVYDYQTSNSALLELIPDNHTYRPGDNATVKIRMTKDGQPVANASVTLSIVDEACFALGDQSISPISAYYNTYAYNDRVTLNGGFDALSRYGGLVYTIEDSMENAEAEAPAASDSGMKGESSESTDIREDFANNPLFETVYLNSEGEAVIQFTVPDNITQWRLTAAGFSAVSGELFSDRDIGQAQTDVICTLPFFVNVSMSDTYILGEDIALMAQVYGTALASPLSVRYTAEISDAEGNIYGKKIVDATSDVRTHFNLGKLDTGSYYLTLTAKAEEYSDGVKIPFTVTRSGVIMTAYKNLSVDEVKSISPALYPVNLTFYNKEYDALFNAASMIRTFYSTRNDSKAAYYAVNSTLREIFGNSGYYDGDLQRIKEEMSAYYGFIPLMEYAEGDVELTAKIAAAVPNVFTDSAKSNLISAAENYIVSRSYRSDEEMCAAMLILSALGEGSLSDLLFVKANSASFSLKAHLYLAAAFAYMGDWSTGDTLLSAVIKAYGKETDGVELCIEGKNTEETIEYTALALMTAALVDRDSADKMAAYLQSHTSGVELYCLELTAYFNTFRPTGDGTDVLIYEINGEEYRAETSPRGTVSLSLNKSEFQSLNITSAGEKTAVRVSYKASPEEALGENSLSETVKISKTITPYDESKGLYTVTVYYTVTTDRNSETFTLTDTIPAGARYFRSYGTTQSNNNGGYSWAYLSNSGQAMNGSISVWNPTEKGLSGRKERTYTGSVSYIIRGSVRGEFVCESASAVSTRTGSYAISERLNIEISEKGLIRVK